VDYLKTAKDVQFTVMRLVCWTLL